MQGNRFEIQTTIKIDGGNDVPLKCRISATEHINTSSDLGAYILQSRSNPAWALRGIRRGSRSGGSHPISTCCLRTIGNRTLCRFTIG